MTPDKDRNDRSLLTSACKTGHFGGASTCFRDILRLSCELLMSAKILRSGWERLIICGLLRFLPSFVYCKRAAVNIFSIQQLHCLFGFAVRHFNKSESSSFSRVSSHHFGAVHSPMLCEDRFQLLVCEREAEITYV